MTTHPHTWTRTTGWRFVRHYLEMVVAMMVGMAVLGPLESVALNPVGWQSVRAVPELDALVMATNMTVAMVGWMRYRRHSWAAAGAMAVAMYLSFVVLFPLLWVGALSAGGMLAGGHVLMLLAMAGVMLLHRDEYAGHPVH
jgi:flagellar biosynthetic protein FliP